MKSAIEEETQNSKMSQQRVKFYTIFGASGEVGAYFLFSFLQKVPRECLWVVQSFCHTAESMGLRVEMRIKLLPPMTICGDDRREYINFCK